MRNGCQNFRMKHRNTATFCLVKFYNMQRNSIQLFIDLSYRTTDGRRVLFKFSARTRKRVHYKV